MSSRPPPLPAAATAATTVTADDQQTAAAALDLSAAVPAAAATAAAAAAIAAASTVAASVPSGHGSITLAEQAEFARAFHCDELFADLPAWLQDPARAVGGGQCSEAVMDLLIALFRRIARWVLLRVRTLRQPARCAHTGGEVSIARRANVRFMLNKLLPDGLGQFIDEKAEKVFIEERRSHASSNSTTRRREAVMPNQLPQSSQRYLLVVVKLLSNEILALLSQQRFSTDASFTSPWSVAQLHSVMVADEDLAELAYRVGMLEDLTGVPDASRIQPPTWEVLTATPMQWLHAYRLEAPFERSEQEKLLDHPEHMPKSLSSFMLTAIRALLLKHAWFHDATRVGEVKARFLRGELGPRGGHDLWLHRRRIRPVAFYGSSWKPRWSQPDARIRRKAEYQNRLAAMKASIAEAARDDGDGDDDDDEDAAAEARAASAVKAIEDGDGHSDDSGDEFERTREWPEWMDADESASEELKSSFSEEGALQTFAFDLIDGAGREWPLIMEYRESTHYDGGHVSPDTAFGALCCRTTLRTLARIETVDQERCGLRFVEIDAVPHFAGFTPLTFEALAEATGHEDGDREPAGCKMEVSWSGDQSDTDEWHREWARYHGLAMPLEAKDEWGTSLPLAPVSPFIHSSTVLAQLRRLIAAASTLTRWELADATMWTTLQPREVKSEFTADAIIQELLNRPDNDVACCFSSLPRDLWLLVADFAPRDLPFLPLDGVRDETDETTREVAKLRMQDETYIYW